jgi:hypothetical protein
LAAAQLGYLNAVLPAAKKSRLAICQEQKKEPPLVDVGEGQYLIEALFECGVSDTSSGTVELPLSWSEIWAYANATGSIKEPWEFRAMMDMSRAFVKARRDGESPFAIAPVDLDND